MKKRGRHLNRFRKRHPTFGESPPDSLFGYFVVKAESVYLNVISSGNAGGTTEVEQWEHVSVSLPNRCPTWGEMCLVKDLFWDEDETVIQFHPKKSAYVNHHEFCLHLWKPPGNNVELPPQFAV